VNRPSWLPLAVVLFIGCSGSPGAPSAQATLSAPATPGSVAGICTGLATPDPATGDPVYAPDPTVAAALPSSIEGQPMTNVESFRWVDYLCTLGGQGAVDNAARIGPAGLNLAGLTYAHGRVQLGDELVSVDAFRTPGQDSSLIVNDFKKMILVLGGGQHELTGTMSQLTLGGKNVWLWTKPDTRVQYLYPRGEILYGVTNATQESARLVLRALP
jgi:hypothetical protein